MGDIFKKGKPALAQARGAEAAVSVQAEAVPAQDLAVLNLAHHLQEMPHLIIHG